MILTTKKGVQQTMKAPVTTQIMKINLFSLRFVEFELAFGEEISESLPN